MSKIVYTKETIMKKRITSLMLVVAMVAMTLVGCGSDTTDTTNTTNNDTNVETTDTTNTTNEPNIETNTEVDEPVEDVATDVPTEEPIETPSVDEPTEDVVVEDGEDDPFIDDYTLVFPEGMTGETTKFVFANDETWSLNYTHYVNSDGNEMNFTWEGPVALGEQATLNGKTLVLLSRDRNYQLRAWFGGVIDNEKFSKDLSFTQETWISFADPSIPYTENGYYDIQTTDTTIETITFHMCFYLCKNRLVYCYKIFFCKIYVSCHF